MVIIMKFGMPTLVTFNNIEENVIFAKNNNLDFIELNMDLPYCFDIENENLKKYNVEFTMHISEKINVASLNENLRISYLDEAIREINLGLKNNIKKYTLHIDSGVYFTLPDKKFFLNEKYVDIYSEHLNESCKVLNELAKKNNISINFENTKIHKFTYKATEIINQYEYLGYTLDIGHNEKNGNKAYPMFLESNKIRHIHLHDFDGKSDHLTLGQGIINLEKYKNVLNDNYIVIEIKVQEELINSINYLHNYFK